MFGARWLFGIGWIVPTALVSCGHTNAATSGGCGSGRTELDGVCVSERIADYVSCVRAQGAQLGSDCSKKLSAEAGYLGTKAAAASDVKDTLEKKYAVSSASELEIVRACSGAAGISNTASSSGPSPASAGEKGRFERGLRAWWKLDEAKGDVAHDASGNKNDGFLDPGLEWTQGRLGGGVRFIGGKRGIRIANTSLLHSDRFLTITLWHNVAALPPAEQPRDWSALIWKGNSPDCTPGCENREYAMYINAQGQFDVAFTPVAWVGKGQLHLWSGGGAVKVNEWHHLALILDRDSTFAGMANDGKKWGGNMDETRSSIRTTTGPLVIGNDVDSKLPFIGVLDDIRIYDRVLTDAELEELASGGG